MSKAELVNPSIDLPIVFCSAIETSKNKSLRPCLESTWREVLGTGEYGKLDYDGLGVCAVWLRGILDICCEDKDVADELKFLMSMVLFFKSEYLCAASSS